jgi:hypothetical protein
MELAIIKKEYSKFNINIILIDYNRMRKVRENKTFNYFPLYNNLVNYLLFVLKMKTSILLFICICYFKILSVII